MDSIAPFVSVVTPFHNTEDYLAECIESVLQQTYRNWEYVLVNNCSSDRSAQIAEHYVKLHPDRLRLVQNETFLSQVQNYNHALQLISPQSKYCKFVQADDLIFPRCLELMVDAAEKDSSIGVVGAYGIEGRTVEFGGLAYPSPVVTGKAVCRLFFLEDFYVFGSPTQLLLRSDLIRSRTPFYDESYYPFEDAAVMFELLANCSFVFVHQVLTFSRRDNASIMKSLLDVDCLGAFRLQMLREFGRLYLEPAEYQSQLRLKERAYAKLLVDGAVGLRGKEFWNFHGAMLKRMGYNFKSAHVWRYLLMGLTDILLNPKRSLGVFVYGLRRSRRSKGGK